MKIFSKKKNKRKKKKRRKKKKKRIKERKKKRNGIHLIFILGYLFLFYFSFLFFYFILFYFILFYFILFYFILFYFLSFFSFFFLGVLFPFSVFRFPFSILHSPCHFPFSKKHKQKGRGIQTHANKNASLYFLFFFSSWRNFLQSLYHDWHNMTTGPFLPTPSFGSHWYEFYSPWASLFAILFVLLINPSAAHVHNFSQCF